MDCPKDASVDLEAFHRQAREIYDELRFFCSDSELIYAMKKVVDRLPRYITRTKC